MTQKVMITSFRTRKEVAAIVGLSDRSFYTLLNSKYFKDKIPPRELLSPAHQILIFDKCGIPYEYEIIE